MAEQQKNANELATERTDLAIHRTIFAIRRTLFGWVRTGLSLVGFGFTIYKLLKTSFGTGKVGMIREQAPRRFGLFLIALGTCAALAGVIEYVRTVKFVNKQSTVQFKSFDFSVIVGLLIALLGLFLLITILINREFF